MLFFERSFKYLSNLFCLPLQIFVAKLVNSDLGETKLKLKTTGAAKNLLIADVDGNVLFFALYLVYNISILIKYKLLSLYSEVRCIFLKHSVLHYATYFTIRDLTVSKLFINMNLSINYFLYFLR